MTLGDIIVSYVTKTAILLRHYVRNKLQLSSTKIYLSVTSSHAGSDPKHTNLFKKKGKKSAFSDIL